MSRNWPARIVTRKVLADKENSGSCCLRWSLAEHKTALLTCEADENPDIAVTDSLYGETAPSPARSAKWSNWVASSPTDLVIRPLSPGEKGGGGRLAMVKESSTRC